MALLLVQPLSHARVSATAWTAARQASLSFTVSWNLLKLMSVEPVMPTSHLILCHPLLLLPSILPSKRLFSNELALHIRLPKYWSFSFSISPSNDYPSNDWFHLGLTALKLINKLKSIKNFCLLRQIAKCSKKGCCNLCSHRQWLGWLDTAPSSEFWKKLKAAFLSYLQWILNSYPHTAARAII